MPVDKFGHTESSSVQRVVAGGVTLTQINNAFVRLDGTSVLTGNLNMGGNSIEGLSNPTEDNHITTKKYVDKSRKKCLVGYIPNLEANNSITGFVASASASSAGHEAYRAFNNLVSGDPWFAGVDGAPTTSLVIKCPEPVIIWRLALKVRMDLAMWDLFGSNDGTRFASLLSSSATLPVGASPTFFNISTTTAYRYYKLTMVEDDWVMNGLEVMKLYVYDT